MEIPEYHYESAETLFEKWNGQRWAAKGKPRLWFKAYEKDGIVVWRDVALGRIKLVTPAGRAEGPDQVSVLGVTALDRRGEIEVNVEEPLASRPEEQEWIGPEKTAAVSA
jgi:hypothetical protein